MRTVVDASVLASLVLAEEGSEDAAARLEGATLHAPELLKYELAQAATRKARRHPERAAEILGRLDTALDSRRGIKWHDVNVTDVALLARVTGLSAYDASYLWLAGWLEADLFTLDKRLAAIGLDPHPA